MRIRQGDRLDEIIVQDRELFALAAPHKVVKRNGPQKAPSLPRLETHSTKVFIAEAPESVPCDVMLGEHVHTGTQPV